MFKLFFFFKFRHYFSISFERTFAFCCSSSNVCFLVLSLDEFKKKKQTHNFNKAWGHMLPPEVLLLMSIADDTLI